MRDSIRARLECHFYSVKEGAVILRLEEGEEGPFAHLTIFAFYALQQLAYLRTVWSGAGSPGHTLAEALLDGARELRASWQPQLAGVKLVAYPGAPAHKRILVRVTVSEIGKALSVHPEGFGFFARLAPVSSRDTAQHAAASVLLFLLHCAWRNASDPIMLEALSRAALLCAGGFAMDKTPLRDVGAKAISVAVASILPKLAETLGIPIGMLEGVVDRVPYPMLGGSIDQLHRWARMSPEVREAEMTALEKLKTTA